MLFTLILVCLVVLLVVLLVRQISSPCPECQVRERLEFDRFSETSDEEEKSGDNEHSQTVLQEDSDSDEYLTDPDEEP